MLLSKPNETGWRAFWGRRWRAADAERPPTVTDTNAPHLRGMSEAKSKSPTEPRPAVLREFLVRAGASLLGRLLFQGLVSLWIEIASHL